MNTTALNKSPQKEVATGVQLRIAARRTCWMHLYFWLSAVCLFFQPMRTITSPRSMNHGRAEQPHLPGV